MATRTSGVSGTIYALVVFVFLFVLSLALAILFYSQKVGVQDQLAQAEDRLEEMVTPQQASSDAYLAVADEASQEGTTVFGLLSSRTEELKRWLTGSPDVSMEELRQRKEQAGVQAGQSALAEISQLRSQLDEAQQRIATLEQGNRDRQQQLEDLRARFESAQNADEEKIAELTQRLNSRIQQFEQFEQQAERERQDLLDRYEQMKEDLRAEIQEREAQIRALRSDIAQKDARIAELTNIVEGSRPTSPDMTLEADGEILEVVPQDNLVYINLGRQDQLILGMTFEVFDEATGIRVEEQRDGRVTHVGGKATIEVVRFSENGETAAARIVRQAFGRPVVAGDVISNIVYDQDRTFRFFVFGDFDLDGDGRATPPERQRVENLIRKWGGEVIEAEEMPVDTDFLVLGEQVEFPEPLPDDPPPTPEQIAEQIEQRERFTRYQELAGLAQELEIPLLNQNRFLTLIGYYQR